MALRRAVGTIVPKLFPAQQAVAPACSGILSQLQAASSDSTPASALHDLRSSWRSFATELAKSPTSSTTSPTTKLSRTPSHNISYDEHHHARFPPSSDNKSFAYLVLTGGRFVYASAIRLAVLKFVVSLSAAADTLALASLEVDISNIQEGETVTVKWRGKPVFIRYRTEEEIEEAKNVNLAELRHPETDVDRAVDPKYLVVVGICTHLGCVPISGAGDYNGWFCPCHGSHYDISGRIRKGPAPYNLEVPEYRFIEDNKVVIG